VAALRAPPRILRRRVRPRRPQEGFNHLATASRVTGWWRLPTGR